MKRKGKYLLLFTTVLTLAKCTSDTRPPVQDQPPAINEVEQISYTITGRLPHDTLAFTEGLLFHQGRLYESTGSPSDMPFTRSVFGPVDTSTGRINVKAELDRNTYFGEGIAFLKGKVFQLTYKNQVCFVYDAKTWKKTGQFSYANKEGWGMTTDSTHLIMSDGTHTLTYLEPDNFRVVRTLQVTENGAALDYLNELEYINGFIYANVWGTKTIVKIDPANGKVTGKMDLAPLFREAGTKYNGSMETNGIAFDPFTKKIYVTGKMWPVLFQIDFRY